MFAKICVVLKFIYFFLLISSSIFATKLDTLKVLDKDYIMVHFKDGIVDYVDDGLGENAFHGHHSDEDNSFAVWYGTPLDLANAVVVNNWVIKSEDDDNYGSDGVTPVAVYRKSKVNGMSPEHWGSDDWVFTYTNEHFIYLALPTSLEQGNTYTIEIDESLNSDTTTYSLTFDIFNSPTEAIHTNLVGYLSNSRAKSADLYHFLGDGGNRDYTSFVGNDVYVYNVDTEESESIGSVKFWMNNKTETNHNLTGSDVWNVDFTGFNQTGTFRIAVEGIGCSEDFEIRDDIYHDPYKLGVLGFFYMRIGQDNMDMTPIPRRPLYIQDQDPSNCKIYVTDMDPYHPSWSSFAPGDKWDRPDNWVQYKKAGNPTNPLAIGGHSDALDWDRHLGHVVNIYDLCLAYIISDGALDDDDLRIAESGNGIPDILDEARNEVDFWLNLRYEAGYSHGITNPDGNNALYQADNTPIAAWANALNSSMLAYSFQIAELNDLKNSYQDSAVVAYNYANNLSNPMWDTKSEGIRGIDFKMMTAAFLYNLTGDTAYEDVVNNESMVTTPNSSIYQNGSYNQLWGTAAYLLTKQPVNYPELYSNMKSALIAKAKSKESDNINKRPSRRGYSNEQSWWQTNQDMHRTILAHHITDNSTDQVTFLDALLMEADWGLGRNPLNMIQMTTATTELADKRSVENCYTSGRDDGTPGLHPGHTPYLNSDGWGGTMAGGNPEKVLVKFYPDYKTWPHASNYINTRHMWAHSEFTPRQTMRGKALLYSYLYALYKTGGTITPILIADAGKDQRITDEDENGKEMVQLDGSGSYSSDSEITSYKWALNESEFASGKTAEVELSIGSFKIILEVENINGETATDTIKIDIVSPTSDIEADYDFESSEQIDDWIPDNLSEGGVPTFSNSSEISHGGTYSAKLSGNFDSNSDMIIKRSGAMKEEAETIIYYVWIPQELVDSSEVAVLSDSTKGGGIQNYLMFTGWQWRSEWYNLYELKGNAWNKISFNIPEDVLNSEILEIGLAFNIQNAGIGESSIFVDDIIFKVPAPPADYDFETVDQFDSWLVANWGGNGESPIAVHSTEVVHGGSYSFKIGGNFVAGSENALEYSGSLTDNVESLLYHVWVPQELVDSASSVNERDSTQVGGIQNFLKHNGWQWKSQWFSFAELSGNDWTPVEFEIPDDVTNSQVQSYGVSFKTLGVDIGPSSVYVDDIYLVKTDDPVDVDDLVVIPEEFRLFNNYPNPFNPTTKIKFNIPVTTKVTLGIYDILGRKVNTLVDDVKTAGSYEVDYNASELASGIYIYSITAGSFHSSQKMMLLK